MDGCVWRANVVKEWDQNRRLLLDAVAVAALLIIVLGATGPVWFTCIGLAFAGAVGTRIGGSETQSGTWEFLLTRPIDRRQWVRMRIALGLAPLLALLLLMFVANMGDLHAHFTRWLVDPVDGPKPEWIEWSAYLNGLAMVVLTYVVAHWMGLREVRANRVQLHSLGAPLVVLASNLWLRVAILAMRHQRTGDFSLLGKPERGADVRLLVSFLLCVMTVIFLDLCERACVRREINATASSAIAEPMTVTNMIVWLVIVLAAAAALFLQLAE